MIKKMTQFGAILGAVMIFGTSLSAQVRNCDLQITINAPGNNAEIQPKDTAWLEFTIKNNGPDPILATDTLFYWDKTNVYLLRAASDIAANATKSYTRSDIGLSIINNSGSPADNSSQICLKVVNQSTISYGNGAGPLITFEDKDTANNWSCVNIVLKGSQPTAIGHLGAGTIEELNLYPNPATKDVRFYLALQQQETVYVAVKDITGREVMRQNYGKVAAGDLNPFHLNTTGLQTGMYFVTLYAGQRKAVARLIVQH